MIEQNGVEKPLEENFDDFSGEVSGDLQDWLAVNNAENKEVKVTLYRYVQINENTFSKEKIFVHTFRNEIPQDDFIGTSYGSGKYLQIITIPGGNGRKPKTNTRTIRIDRCFDKPIITNQPQQQYNPIIAPANDSKAFSEGIQLAMSMQSNMMAMILPLLNKPAVNNPAGDAIGVYGMLQEVLKKNLRDNADLFKQLAPNFAGVNQNNEIESEPKTLLEQIAPLLTSLIPLLPQAAQKPVQITQAAVQAVPAVGKVVKTVMNKKISNIGKNYGKDITETNKVVK